jgi:FkbM family methyltransferase
VRNPELDTPWQNPDNKIWVPTTGDQNGDDHVRTQIQHGVVFDEHVIRVIKHFAKPDTCLVDGGANYGQMSTMLSTEFAHVHSIEASPYVSWFLKKTAAEFPNITVHEAALWHTSGERIKMFEPDGSADGRFFSGMGIAGPHETRGHLPTVNVTSMTIDDIDFQQPVSVIKLDIQGPELMALRGAVQTIARYRPMIIWEYEQPYEAIFGFTHADCAAFFESIDYELRIDIINNNHDFCYTPKAT